MRGVLRLHFYCVGCSCVCLHGTVRPASCTRVGAAERWRTCTQNPRNFGVCTYCSSSCTLLGSLFNVYIVYVLNLAATHNTPRRASTGSLIDLSHRSVTLCVQYSNTIDAVVVYVPAQLTVYVRFMREFRAGPNSDIIDMENSSSLERYTETSSPAPSQQQQQQQQQQQASVFLAAISGDLLCFILSNLHPRDGLKVLYLCEPIRALVRQGLWEWWALALWPERTVVPSVPRLYGDFAALVHDGNRRGEYSSGDVTDSVI